MLQCPVCKKGDWSKFLEAPDMYSGRMYAIHRCANCGVGQTEDSGEFASEHLYMYGGSADAGRRFGLAQWALQAFRRARVRVIGSRQPGRVLDVGCGDGSFLSALAERGWDVEGTELSESIAATARRRLGERVRVGEIGDVCRSDALFDLVTLWHVLEHLPDPARVLAEVHRHATVGAYIVVAVPNIESWQAKLIAQDWLHLDVPRHRWHFSQQTIAALADRCGFQVERIKHFSWEYGPFAILQGMATKLGLGHSLFTRLVRLSPFQLMKEPLFWVHVPLLVCASVPCLLFELCAAVAGRGGAIVVICRPK